jgi:AcrR family transcriptional regulator
MTANENDQQNRRTQIIEAALKVFSKKGFHKATNKDIADAAGGISPGLIYWYFKDKQDLLLSIFRERIAVLELADHPERVLELPPHAALTLIARSYMSIFQVPGNVALLRLLFSEIIRFEQMSELFYRFAASRFFGLIDGYLQHQVALGALQPHNTSTAARSFVGMLIVQVIARELLHQPEAMATPDEEIIATIVDIFLQGLAVAGD